MNEDIELTPEEREQFRNLPREAMPSAFLWERIVRPLHEDGTLGDPAGVRAFRQMGRVGQRWSRPWAVAAAAIAASLVLFVSGALFGSWMAGRSTERAFVAVREHDAAQLAQRVQEAGTAYVSALVALSDMRPGVSGPAHRSTLTPARSAFEIRQGRDAAFAALYGAAVELGRIAPGDPDVAEILRVLEERQFAETGAGREPRTVWY